MSRIKEIDLHVDAFITNTSGFSNENLIQLSLERMCYELDNAIEKGNKEIRFIHGHGTGVLRDRVYSRLRVYQNNGLIESIEPWFFNPAVVNVIINY